MFTSSAKIEIDIDEELWLEFKKSLSRRGVDARLSPDKREIIYTSQKSGKTTTSHSRLVQKD